MPNPATTDDLEARWRPLSAQEATVGGTLLDDAWGMLQRRVDGIADLLADDADLEAEVVRILATAVLRVMKNPDGKRQESIDDYSWTRDNAVSAGVLYFTDDEIGDLTPDGNNGAYSVDLLGPDWATQWSEA